jgi:hypothetical protein
MNHVSDQDSGANSLKQCSKYFAMFAMVSSPLYHTISWTARTPQPCRVRIRPSITKAAWISEKALRPLRVSPTGALLMLFPQCISKFDGVGI